MPKISIILALSSKENIASLCIESLLSQTFNDFECLCSIQSNEEYTFLESLLKKDSRFKLIKTPTENPTKWECYNASLYQLRGENILFINDTDLLHKQALDIFSDALKYSHAHIAIAETSFFSTGVTLKSQKKHISFDKGILKQKNQNLIPQLWQSSSCQSNLKLEGKMFTSEIIAYLKFHPNLGDYAPLFFMEQFYSLSNSSTYIKYPLYLLRKEAHIPSVSSFATLLNLKERIIFEYAYFIEAGRIHGYATEILKRKCSQDLFHALKHVIFHTPESTLICINQAIINLIEELKEYDILQGSNLSLLQKITLFAFKKNKINLAKKLFSLF